MEDNPYSTILNTMKSIAGEKLPVFFRFGTVISTDEEPIKRILVGEIEYRSQKGELMIPAGMTLRYGDVLLLLPFDEEQKMVIINKVVDL